MYIWKIIFYQVLLSLSKQFAVLNVIYKMSKHMGMEFVMKEGFCTSYLVFSTERYDCSDQNTSFSRKASHSSRHPGVSRASYDPSRNRLHQCIIQNAGPTDPNNCKVKLQ